MITRYDMEGDARMTRHQEGDYVEYSDYEELERKFEVLKSIVREIHAVAIDALREANK